MPTKTNPNGKKSVFMGCFDSRAVDLCRESVPGFELAEPSNFHLFPGRVALYGVPGYRRHGIERLLLLRDDSNVVQTPPCFRWIAKIGIESEDDLRIRV
ncbi:MAG: hypothetical protein L0Z50_16790, partial [Verrucomicrobiales bacterium]|nr:hypothetical protein [Verrucomicrobiales bacterium]